jgi:hypothetical protein
MTCNGQQTYDLTQTLEEQLLPSSSTHKLHLYYLMLSPIFTPVFLSHLSSYDPTSPRMYVYRFQNVFLRCPTPRLHCFLSSHWPSFRFLSCMAFCIPSVQFFFGLPRAVYSFGIHFNAILGSLPSAIL